MANSNYLTNAINLKSYNLSESDKIVLMYSREYGLLKGIAKGSKKPKNKLGGRMDTLVANKLMLYKGKNLDTICQAEALNTFTNIRTDMDKMLYAMYISEIVTNYSSEEDPNSSEIYDIFYKALSKISKSKSNIEILLCTMRFQLKIMQICGYELQLKYCLLCGCEINEKSGCILSTEKGGTSCISCAQGTKGIKFPNKLREFLCALATSDFDETTYYDEKANIEVSTYCFSLLKDYVETHCTKQFKTTKLLTCPSPKELLKTR